jgi:hypothetical protein
MIYSLARSLDWFIFVRPTRLLLQYDYITTCTTKKNYPVLLKVLCPLAVAVLLHCVVIGTSTGHQSAAAPAAAIALRHNSHH